jgi:nitrite reductase/ring-hydroxylating ferredoxin subunit
MTRPGNALSSDPSGAMPRRTFCAAALAAAASLSCGGGGSAAAVAPAPPPPTPSGALLTTDTRSALLATPNGTTHDYRDLGNFLLLKDANGIYAMTAICTHQGCSVGLPAGDRITCPCHGSVYDLGGGNLLGPAVSPLVHLEVTEATPGGLLTVNTLKVVAASVRLA